MQKPRGTEMMHQYNCQEGHARRTQEIHNTTLKFEFSERHKNIILPNMKQETLCYNFTNFLYTHTHTQNIRVSSFSMKEDLTCYINIFFPIITSHAAGIKRNAFFSSVL